jgi:hypothetical protein
VGEACTIPARFRREHAATGSRFCQLAKARRARSIPSLKISVGDQLNPGQKAARLLAVIADPDTARDPVAEGQTARFQRLNRQFSRICISRH